MKCIRPFLRAWHLIMVLACVSPATGPGQSLSDFGYRKWHRTGSMPTVGVLVNYDHGSVLDPVLYQDWFFNPGATQGINAYFAAVSNNRFQLATGGVVTVESTDPFSHPNLGKQYSNPDGPYFQHVLGKAIDSGQFDYASRALWQTYPWHPTGYIYTHMLHHLIVDPSMGGMVRSGHIVRHYGERIIMQDTFAAAGTNLMVQCHELIHMYNGIDMYGLWGRGGGNLHHRLSSMGPSAEVYLDPWHRLRFGWIEPRIFPISTDRSVLIPAAQSGEVDAAVILYHSDRGAREFFILEYRTRTTSAGLAEFEKDLPDDGLVIWHIRQDSNKEPVHYADAAYPTGVEKRHECKHCDGLIRQTHLGKPSVAPCSGNASGHFPRYGTAAAPKPGDTRGVLKNTPSEIGEEGWRECTKCRQLFFNPRQHLSVCAAGGRHEAGTDQYVPFLNEHFQAGQGSWYRCGWCQTLVFDADPRTDSCPHPHVNRHAIDHSTTQYRILSYGKGTKTVMAVSAPDMIYGANGMWNSINWVTPNLRWYDRTRTPYQLYVDHTPGADEIRVAWAHDKINWVGFSYSGSKANGWYDTPYKTIQTAYANTPDGWTIRIKPSTTTGTIHFERPMTIEAYEGTVVIGQ